MNLFAELTHRNELHFQALLKQCGEVWHAQSVLH